MTPLSLVTLDCITGEVARYRRAENNKPERTGHDFFPNWQSDRFHEAEVFDLLQAYRTGYEPPEDPTPRPTSPMRDQREHQERIAA